MDQPKIDWQAVTVLAKQAAIRAVKKRLRSEGRVKVPLLSHSQIAILANEHLRQHS